MRYVLRVFEACHYRSRRPQLSRVSCETLHRMAHNERFQCQGCNHFDHSMKMQHGALYEASSLDGCIWGFPQFSPGLFHLATLPDTPDSRVRPSRVRLLRTGYIFLCPGRDLSIWGVLRAISLKVVKISDRWHGESAVMPHNS